MSGMESFVGYRESWAADGPNGRLKIVKHSPDADPDSQRPKLVIIPGWSNGRETMAALAKRASAMDFDTFTFSYNRSTKPDCDPITHNVLTAEAVVHSALERFGGETVQAKGFSRGGRIATELAMFEHKMQSGLIEKATLDAPASITTDSLPRLVGGAGMEVLNAALDVRYPRRMGKKAVVGAFSGMYIMEDIKQSAEEVFELANASVTDKIAALHEAHFPIGVTGLTRDGFFPAHNLRKATPDGVPFAEVNGTHLDYLVDPAVQDFVLDFHRNQVGSESSAAA